MTAAPPANPFTNPERRSHIDGPFLREEVALANRNHGTALEMLRHDVTPPGMHYLLNHFDIPYVPDAAAWSIEVTGRVRRPLALSVGDIRALPQRTLRVTLECAGNGRALHSPRWPSMPWTAEAVGTAEWTGTPLRHVLHAAGLQGDAAEIAFLGADRGFDRGHEHAYGRSLSRDVALGDDVLLVHAMNGQPLLPQHGFPLRLVVPGWYGMASVKWLTRIEVLDRPYDGFQQVQTYIYKRHAGDPGVPVTHMRVKSLMVPPGIPDWYTRRRLVDAGTVTLDGRAWSGDGLGITRVEVAVDGEWHEARLGPASAHKYAWRAWSFDWKAQPGEHRLACRATDAAGNLQPLGPMPDRGGFGTNSAHAIEVSVR